MGSPENCAVPSRYCRGEWRESERGAPLWGPGGCGKGEACSHGSRASHPIAFNVAVAVCQGSEGFPPPAPGASAASGHIWSRRSCCSWHTEPLQSFPGRGGASVACPAPRAPWDGRVVGWEEGAPSTQLSGPGLGSAERVPGTAALCRESQRGWFASRSPKLFGDTASPATSSSSPPRLRHQTFTNAPAGTFLGVDVLFWFGSNLFPVDTAAALLELAGPEQG